MMLPRLVSAANAVPVYLRLDISQDLDALKDAVHQRLLFLCEEDTETGCWVYTGPWQRHTGLGVIRIAGRQWTVHRVSAWVYLGGFELADRTVQIRHRCRTPACFHPDHLEIRHKTAIRLPAAATKLPLAA